MENFRKCIQLAVNDNVLIICTDIKANEILIHSGTEYLVDRDIAIGHKIATKNIAKGGSIIKFSTIIGTATKDIKKGEHVHIHNIKSNFIPIYKPK